MGGESPGWGSGGVVALCAPIAPEVVLGCYLPLSAMARLSWREAGVEWLALGCRVAGITHRGKVSGDPIGAQGRALGGGGQWEMPVGTANQQAASD